ncbi:hypothetical protein [Desulfuribacillus alkaliarsenatis]|uniref:Uncharacterized protein n=1 Tax=Desulfuribacillus alkaliarsenatis TaxID=766136 RepID=A0A1E5G0A3_9FIRM|nr:hypothetical protein [Desulfuribacillus alkaliarsenatis]OEF96129.1 hypothetical protein BHF68_10380 [Desulfuribacillus alkaliarsenatis]
MMIKNNAFLVSLMICTMILFTGCASNESVEENPDELIVESNGFNITTSDEQLEEALSETAEDKDINKKEFIEDKEPSIENNSPRLSTYELMDSEVAEFYSYNYQDKSMYIAGLKLFDEFGKINEGGASINNEENILRFNITKATGSVTGTIDGPQVTFDMNLTTNEIIEKEFNPAPNYAELGITEFAHNSEKVIELSDERMVEIGVYFKNLIKEIDKKNE